RGRLRFDERLASGLERQTPGAVRGRDERDAVTERLEQLDADTERSEERCDHRGRTRVDDVDVAPEAEHRYPRTAPRRRHDLLTRRVGRQTGAGDLERRLWQPLAHQRPYLSTEPVDTAHVGFPAQLPRVAKTRRIAVALAAALDRHDLRHQARLYTGEVAKPERIALGDRADRID